MRRRLIEASAIVVFALALVIQAGGPITTAPRSAPPPKQSGTVNMTPLPDSVTIAPGSVRPSSAPRITGGSASALPSIAPISLTFDAPESAQAACAEDCSPPAASEAAPNETAETPPAADVEVTAEKAGLR